MSKAVTIPDYLLSDYEAAKKFRLDLIFSQKNPDLLKKNRRRFWKGVTLLKLKVYFDIFLTLTTQ